MRKKLFYLALILHIPAIAYYNYTEDQKALGKGNIDFLTYYDTRHGVKNAPQNILTVLNPAFMLQSVEEVYAYVIEERKIKKEQLSSSHFIGILFPISLLLFLISTLKKWLSFRKKGIHDSYDYLLEDDDDEEEEDDDYDEEEYERDSTKEGF